MVLLIIFLAIILYLAILAGIDCEDFGIGLIIFMVLFFISGLFYWGISAASYCAAEKQSVVVSKQEIYSLADNTGAEGRFLLGGGTIKTEMYYFYYIKVRGTFKIHKVKADDVFLHEDDITKAYVEEREIRAVHPKNWLLFDLPSTETHIYVPKGTVVQHYRIDLE